MMRRIYLVVFYIFRKVKLVKILGFLNNNFFIDVLFDLVN